MNWWRKTHPQPLTQHFETPSPPSKMLPHAACCVPGEAFAANWGPDFSRLRSGKGTCKKWRKLLQDFSFWNLLILYLLGLITLKTGNSSLLRLPKILAYTVIKSPRDHPSLPEANTFWLCNWRGSPWELDTGQKLLNLTAVLTVLDRCFSHSKSKKIPTLKYT